MLLHVTSARAFFHPGEPILLRVTTDSPLRGEVKATIYHFDEPVACWTTQINGTDAQLRGTVPMETRRAFLVHAEIDGQSAFTAFDVLERWTDAPRYGFLHDFRPNRPVEDIQGTLDYLLALHVNGLQFYDWQYRHDTLLPPGENADTFTDPLGRALSLETVRNLIDAAHERGIAAMPYTAIYGASPAFASEHPDWQLFDPNQQPIDFAGGFLKIMNPRSAWQAHFIQECCRVLAALPFDGIHVDQYGDPRTGFDSVGNPVDMPAGFAETLLRLREKISSDKALLFNLVHNWPADVIASSPLDFWYSELWPPDTQFTTLWRTLDENRHRRPRPAVLAVYIPPEWEHTVYAAHTTILAGGGAHIAHGEQGQYLSDPYFPKAGKPSPELAERLRQAADFAVAYEEALIFCDGYVFFEIAVEWNGKPLEPGQAIISQVNIDNRVFVNILNNAGRWDSELPAPEPLERVKIIVSMNVIKAWYATPAAPIPQPLADLEHLPPISDWILVCLELKGNPHG